jgi:hypothetical protein
MATNGDQVEKDTVPPVPSPVDERRRAVPNTSASAVKGACIGAVVLGVIGVIVGLGVAIVSAVLRGFITDWAVIAAFGMIVTALAGGIYGALAGAVSGGVVGAIIGVVKSGKR